MIVRTRRAQKLINKLYDNYTFSEIYKSRRWGKYVIELEDSNGPVAYIKIPKIVYKNILPI